MNSEARTALLDHYDEARRELPWRGETDPYRILVSEVMLQQTRVETVRGYYEPWLERFPDVDTLADATEDDVLKAWEGLGYYRRARNLQAAARVVRDRPEGFPATSRELRDLPGVGEYTAGAVASIAFGEAVPAVDGNVRRVLARWFDEPEPAPSWLRERAAALVDAERPGDWNQALMELGATVCTPRAPRCPECPVRSSCAARAAGTQEERPVAVRKAPPRTAEILLGVFEREGRVLLVRRPEDGLLGGMWALPEAEMLDSPGDVGATDALLGALTASVEVAASGAARPLEPVRHRFTHLDATYRPWVVPVDAEPAPDAPDRAWVSPHDAGGLAVPVAQRKVLDLVAREAS